MSRKVSVIRFRMSTFNIFLWLILSLHIILYTDWHSCFTSCYMHYITNVNSQFYFDKIYWMNYISVCKYCYFSFSFSFFKFWSILVYAVSMLCWYCEASLTVIKIHLWFDNATLRYVWVLMWICNSPGWNFRVSKLNLIQSLFMFFTWFILSQQVQRCQNIFLWKFYQNMQDYLFERRRVPDSI